MEMSEKDNSCACQALRKEPAGGIECYGQNMVRRADLLKRSCTSPFSLVETGKTRRDGPAGLPLDAWDQ
jgi:hypothetical protein